MYVYIYIYIYTYRERERWSNGDNCGCYCTGRARDCLPGSFVYCTDNTSAPPPKPRSKCYPAAHGREALWRNGSWNAKFMCRTCLVQAWGKSPDEITEWLAMQKPRTIESSLDPGAPMEQQRWQRMAESQMGTVPPRHMVGRQPEQLDMKSPHDDNPHPTIGAHSKQSHQRQVDKCLVEIGALTRKQVHSVPTYSRLRRRRK